MPMLQRARYKLLKKVDHKPHAEENDHHETAGTTSNPENPSISLTADPLSSSDEKSPPVLSSSPPPAQYEPPPRYGGRRLGIPKCGAYTRNIAKKEQESAKEELKEAENTEPQLPNRKSVGRTHSQSESGDLDDFGEMNGPPAKKRKQNYTANVHAAALPKMLGASTRTYGRENTDGFKQPPSNLESRKKKPTNFRVPKPNPFMQARSASKARDFKIPAAPSDAGSSSAVSDDTEAQIQKTSQNTETSREGDTFDPAPFAASKKQWRSTRQQTHNSSDNTMSTANTKSGIKRKFLGFRIPTSTSKLAKRGTKKGSKDSSTSDEAGAAKPGFRMPASLDALGDSLSNLSSPKRFKQPNLHPDCSGSSSPLTSPSSSPIFSSQTRPHLGSPQLGPHCPLCRSAVDGDHLFAFMADHPRMNVRMQAKFCREHQKRSAEATYTSLGYPHISWPKLDQRLQRHYPQLDAILAGTAPSHFRARLAEKVARGEDRTLLGAIMTDDFKSSTTGYYGARGARVLMECITSAFARELRQLAPTDKLIAAGGVGQFVQEVLVPELATLLVMEDMGVEEERAREILRESGPVGDLVHEEDDDAVRRGSDGRVVVVAPEGWDGTGDEEEAEGDEESAWNK